MFLSLHFYNIGKRKGDLIWFYIFLFVTILNVISKIK